MRRLLWRPNPVVLKDLRGRMRGRRAFVVLTVYLLVMGVYVGVVSYLYGLNANQVSSPYSAEALGQNLFLGLAFIELLLASFIPPGVTAGAISGERDKQTLDILRTTLLPTSALVMGKLWSALIFVLVLMLAAVPIQSLAFLLGGVTPGDFLVATTLWLATAYWFGAAGIFFSAWFRRTLAATVASYGFMLANTLGLPLLLVPVALLGSNLPEPNSTGLRVLAQYAFQAVTVTNPFVTAVATASVLYSSHTLGYYTSTVYPLSGGNPITLPFISPWLPYALLCLGGGSLLLLAAIQRLQHREP